MKSTLLSAAFILSTYATIGQAATVNWALEGTATASRRANDAALAIDGDETTFWNALTHPSDRMENFIEIDLGQLREVSAVRALVEQSPNGDTQHNVFLDGVESFTWEQETFDGQWLTFVLPEPTQVQVVRINTVSSPSFTAWSEIQILQGDVAPVPLPASGLLLVGSVFGLGWVKRRSAKSSARAMMS